MAIELERWKNQEDLTSQNFNRRLLELEKHFNSLAEKNTKLEKENKKLKEQLDNKVDFLFGEKVIELVKDATNTKSFIGVGKVTDDSVGLGKESWYHFIYLSHYGGDGYGSVVAIPFNVTTVYVRSSNGTHWTAWRSI